MFFLCVMFFCKFVMASENEPVENKIPFGNHHVQVPYNPLSVRISSQGLHVETSYVCFAG